jgi:hypothetical protein
MWVGRAAGPTSVAGRTGFGRPVRSRKLRGRCPGFEPRCSRMRGLQGRWATRGDGGRGWVSAPCVRGWKITRRGAGGGAEPSPTRPRACVRRRAAAQAAAATGCVRRRSSRTTRIGAAAWCATAACHRAAAPENKGRRGQSPADTSNPPCPRGAGPEAGGRAGQRTPTCRRRQAATCGHEARTRRGKGKLEWRATSRRGPRSYGARRAAVIGSLGGAQG